MTDKQIQKIEKKYRQNEPEQFLTMYDAIRDNDNDKTREQWFLLCNFMIKLENNDSYFVILW